MEQCFTFLLPYVEGEDFFAEQGAPTSIEVIGGRYAAATYCNRPELMSDNFFYSAVPRCFALMQEDVSDAIGIESLRRLPGLDLYGQGVLFGLVDTGITYGAEAFRSRNGMTRIVSVWDQTGEEQSGQNVPYGRRFSREELQDGTAQTEDSIGHGTLLARIAAGSESGDEGIAPNVELVVVKLRNAPEELRQYHRIASNAPCYSEVDIMFGLQYLVAESARLERPMVILLSLGTNMGGHTGTGYLEQYIDDICRMRGRQVVIAAGNEANKGHHFHGRLTEDVAMEAVQFRVQNGESLTMELWCEAPNLLSVGVESPGGEVLRRIDPVSGRYESRTLRLEGTTIAVTYQTIGLHTTASLVLLRFQTMSEGIWTVRVYPERTLGGQTEYHCWLPVTPFLKGSAEFLRPDPDITVTEPGNSEIGMAIGAYDAFTGSIEPASGRGFALNSTVKPDVVAPMWQGSVPGADTSQAAAVAAGANALLLEWAVVRENRPFLTGAEAKTYFINGAVRDERTYPNREWGYGKLSIFGAIAENR